jgi:hypothetical protein
VRVFFIDVLFYLWKEWLSGQNNTDRLDTSKDQSGNWPYFVFFSFENRQKKEWNESVIVEEFVLIDLFVLFVLLKGFLVQFLQDLQKLHNIFYAMTLQKVFITLISMIG